MEKKGKLLGIKPSLIIYYRRLVCVSVCVAYLALISTYFFSFFLFFINKMTMTESNVRNGKFWTSVYNRFTLYEWHRLAGEPCVWHPVSYVVFTQKPPSLYYSHDAGTCAYQVLTSWYQFNLPRKWRSRCSRKRMLPLKGPKITSTIFTSDRQRLYDALFYHLITLDCKDGSQSAYFCFVLSLIFWKVLLASN